MYQLDKSFEQIFLPVDSSRVVLLEDTMCLIVNVQKETLYVVAKDLQSESAMMSPLMVRVRSAGSVTTGFSFRK